MIEEQQKIEAEIRKNRATAILMDNGLNDNDNIESIEMPLVPNDSLNISVSQFAMFLHIILFK